MKRVGIGGLFSSMEVNQLTPGARLVYIALVEYCHSGKRTRKRVVEVDEIAEMCGCTVGQVNSAMGSLEEFGFIKRDKKNSISFPVVHQHFTFFDDNEDSEKLIELKKILQELCEYWQEVMDSKRCPRITNERLSMISARLQQGYTVQQLKMAINGCRASDFHMGHNDKKRKYNSLKNIFENADKTDRFIGIAEGLAPTKRKTTLLTGRLIHMEQARKRMKTSEGG